jgi:quinol---cytochrome c reductase iron-sulfur subunit
VSSPGSASAPVVCFALGTLSAIGFAVAYGLDLSTPYLGVTSGLAFAFISLGLALWASSIDKAEPEYVEEREVGPTPSSEFEAFHRALTTSPIPRARLLWSMLGVSFGAVGLAALFPLRSLFPNPGGDPHKLLSTTAWHKGRLMTTEEGVYIRPDDLETGSVMTAFPEGYDTRIAEAATLLIRVQPDELVLPRSRQDWVVDGIVAYSKLCTHAGCPVGLYAQESHLLLCPCHHSIFDVLRGAQPVEGPAAHPLPQLPLGVSENGFLMAEGDFSGPVGAAWWGYEQ